MHTFGGRIQLAWNQDSGDDAGTLLRRHTTHLTEAHLRAPTVPQSRSQSRFRLDGFITGTGDYRFGLTYEFYKLHDSRVEAEYNEELERAAKAQRERARAWGGPRGGLGHGAAADSGDGEGDGDASAAAAAGSEADGATGDDDEVRHWPGGVFEAGGREG